MAVNVPSCEARTLVKDDRMGGWFNYCELPKGHRGQHKRTLTATEPMAAMRWSGTHDSAKPCDACGHKGHAPLACMAGNGRNTPPILCGCVGFGPKPIDRVEVS